MWRNGPFLFLCGGMFCCLFIFTVNFWHPNPGKCFCVQPFKPVIHNGTDSSSLNLCLPKWLRVPPLFFPSFFFLLLLRSPSFCLSSRVYTHTHTSKHPTGKPLAKNKQTNKSNKNKGRPWRGTRRREIDGVIHGSFFFFFLLVSMKTSEKKPEGNTNIFFPLCRKNELMDMPTPRASYSVSQQTPRHREAIHYNQWWCS